MTLLIKSSSHLVLFPIIGEGPGELLLATVCLRVGTDPDFDVIIGAVGSNLHGGVVDLQNPGEVQDKLQSFAGGNERDFH